MVSAQSGVPDVVCVQDETCQEAPPEQVAKTVVREERQSFNNQPLKGLENLKLF